MPLKGILDTARSLTYYARRQEVTANNLANANSDAFKADRITARAIPGAEFPVPVQHIDLDQGTFRETGRSLDIALDGPGFFVVQTAQGERLTRGGSLKLDPAGRITDAHDNLVLGDGGPILVQGGTLEVQGDGTVMVDGASAGRLRMVDPRDKSALLKEGFGRYVCKEPLVPVEEGVTRVRQGAIEEANLDSLLSMVDLVAIQRAYSANVDALKAMDGVLGSIVNEVGKV